MFKYLDGDFCEKYTFPDVTWDEQYCLIRNDQVITHRENGPAIIVSRTINNWYYFGKYIPVTSQQEFEKYIKLIAFL